MLLRPSLCLALLSACSTTDAAPAAPATGLVPSYVTIAVALASDQVEPVAAAATELVHQADALQGKPGIEKVVASAKRMSGSDIAATRVAFKGLSDGVVEYMRATPAAQAGHVLVFCPMAFEDKGALWVQAEGKLANPYFGAAMLRCGTKLAWDAELPSTAAL